MSFFCQICFFYQEVVASSTEHVKSVIKFLQDINTLLNKDGSKPFEAQVLSEDFKKFHEINQLNVDALNKNLEQEDAHIFTIIEKVTRALFTNGTNKLFTTIEGIVTKLKSIKSSNNSSDDDNGKNK